MVVVVSVVMRVRRDEDCAGSTFSSMTSAAGVNAAIFPGRSLTDPRGLVHSDAINQHSGLVLF